MSMPPQGPGPQGPHPQGGGYGQQGPPPGWQPGPGGPQQGGFPPGPGTPPQGMPPQGMPPQGGYPQGGYQQGYPQQPGGPAYPPQPGPKKKSKLPMIIGIVLGVIALVAIVIVILNMTVFKTPTLPADKTRELVGGGLAVGGDPMTKVNETSAQKAFPSSDSCSTPSREALGSAAPVFSGGGDDAVITVGRFADEKAAGTAYETITKALQNCTAKAYRINQPNLNRASSNGASYQTFKLTPINGGSSAPRDILVIDYGNTLAIATSKSLGDPKTTVDGYTARYKQVAKG